MRVEIIPLMLMLLLALAGEYTVLAIKTSAFCRPGRNTNRERCEKKIAACSAFNIGLKFVGPGGVGGLDTNA
jgi:hypothetical protein